MATPWTPERRAARLGTLVLAVALIGCGGGGGGTPAAPTDGAPTGAAPTDGGPASPGTGTPPAGDLPSPWPDAEGDLIPIRIAQSVPALSFAPLLVAVELNFFGNQGLDVEYVELQSGATAMQALTGGSIDLTDSASTEVGAAVGEGIDLLAIQNTIMMTLEVCADEAFMQEKGVTPDSPLEERLAAFEGATVGITGPGAVSDRAMRWLLQTYGGLDPNTQATFTQVGGAAAMAGALDSGQIQGYLLSPPNCGRSENGIVLVPPQDVPEFENYIHEVLFGTREWIEANADAAMRAATAVSMGNNYILQNPDEALAILQSLDPETDPEIIRESFEQVILPAIVEDGRMTSEMWESTSKVLTEAGAIDQPLDTTEGSFWTNEYIGDASID